VYHVELRQFPHNLCRFNLSGAQVRAIVEPWVRDPFVEFEERKWTPHDAKLTILEGPQIPLGQLTMGRGWRAAERQSEDVTDTVLAAARQAVAAAVGAAGAAVGIAPAGAAGTPATAAAAGVAAAGDAFALGVQMAALLGPDPMRVLDAWRAAAAASPELAPSEALARAEQAIRAGDADRG
jgi:hypothetical protein